MNDIILKTEGITKSFFGVKALDKVNFDVRKGEVHGIVGENGAGKSTLMSVLTGVHLPEEGQIFFEDNPVQILSPHHASELGISLVFQELSLVPNLSVAENIYANTQPINALNLINSKKMYRQANDLLKLFKVDIDSSDLVLNLSVAQQQVVEILKAISKNPKVLILDEPTSSITTVEKDCLFELIRNLKGTGTSILYISHHLREIFEICDRVTVLKDGKYVCTNNITEVDENYVVTKMVGRELGDIYGQRTHASSDQVVFQVKNCTKKNTFENINFSIYRGEILGIYGLVGSGRTEFARTIIGCDNLDEGKFILNDCVVKNYSVSKAIQNRMLYVTEDRKQDGLYLQSSIAMNLIANHLKDFADGIFLNEKKINEYAKNMVDSFRIRTPSIFQKLENLSGGNQQKVLLSAWLSLKPELLIVDEPTRGVDVGSRNDIYTFMRSCAQKGSSIIMISSDLLEILGLSDRILVMKDGKIVREMDASDATEEKIISIATGVEVDGRQII
ncbi:putative ribose/galactose/methyl galactoside import ATP-binding protein 1 [Clostridia bacterium]|nr:putative ribose/galactose/methyl galactoside import ATP-binding protein 1 [Clostridia bacterium]